MMAASAAAYAQAGIEGGGLSLGKLTVTPTFSSTLTLTDNVNLSAHDRRADAIAQLSPGVQVSSDAGRIKGFLGYSLNALVHAEGSSANDVQHLLNGAATVEAVENWAFVDVTGSSSQRAISAFGTLGADNASNNSNQTAVYTYSIAPYVRGRLGSLATYDARVTYSAFHSGSSVASSASTTDAVMQIGGPGDSLIGWSLTASRQWLEEDTGGTLYSARLRGVVSYALTPELRVSVNAGRESENFEGSGTQSQTTKGWGLDWTPTERTRLSLFQERRFFGDSHVYTFQHRTPRTVVTYTDSRDVTTGFGQLRFASLGTIYDLFFFQFASIEPDPVARAVLVTNFLKANNIAPNGIVLVGSLASASLVQRNQTLSFAWTGLRDTLLVGLSQSRGERADRVVVVTDDFSNGNLVRQRGLTVGWSHRLTPSASLSATATATRNSGSVDGRSSELRFFTVTWTETLNERTSVSLTGRHSRGDRSGDEAYTERALIATLSMRF